MKFELQIDEVYSRSLLTSTYLNVLKNWEGALTGPLIRKDWATVDRNLAALEGDPLKEIYQAFVQKFGGARKNSVQITYLEPGEMGL
jgi:predicted short-subunit dehydrogenase-like oxidoreductase (DUF2520 family)